MSIKALSTKEITETCKEYVALIDLTPIHQKGTKQLEETATGILTRLDEYNEHLDHIHSSTQKVSDDALPELLLLARNLELLYKKIDAISEYVEFVSNKVDDLDKKVAEIEKQDGTALTNLVGSLGSLLGKSKQNKQKGEPIAFSSTDYNVNPMVVKEDVKKHEKKHEEWRATKKAELEQKENEKKEKIQQTQPLDLEIPPPPEEEEILPPAPQDESMSVQNVAPSETGVEAEGEE